MQKFVPYVAQLVAPLVSIHVVGLPDPYRLPYESASFLWFSRESRRGELPVELRMGQAFTYWRPQPEVSPDEGFRREAETSINSMLFWLY